MFMAMTRSLMRAEARRTLSPREVIQGVNLHLLDMNDAGMFVTVLYGVLDTESLEFTYARAGHKQLLLCDSEGEIVKPRSGVGQALGIFPQPAIDEQSLRIDRGQTVFLYTDGLTDALDEQGVSFGLERVIDLLSRQCHSRAQAICDTVLDGVMSHQRLVHQFDDVTVLAFSRITA
jgi:phosphoserine phosphatase RsbU/P